MLELQQRIEETPLNQVLNMLDVDNEYYLSFKKLLTNCFIRGQRNALSRDMWIHSQDKEDCMQEGFLRSWQDLQLIDESQIESRFTTLKYILVKNYTSAIQGTAYRVIKAKMRLIDIDAKLDEEGTTLAEILECPNYEDLSLDYLIMHFKESYAMPQSDIQKIYDLASRSEEQFNAKDRKTLSRIKAKYKALQIK